MRLGSQQSRAAVADPTPEDCFGGVGEMCNGTGNCPNNPMGFFFAWSLLHNEQIQTRTFKSCVVADVPDGYCMHMCAL